MRKELKLKILYLPNKEYQNNKFLICDPILPKGVLRIKASFEKNDV